MKKFDVVIIGAGRAGKFIANNLIAQGKNVLPVALPESPEDYLEHLVDVIASPPFGRSNLAVQKAEIASSASGLLAMTANSTPQFLNPRTLLLDGEEIQAKRFVIASGCRPRIPEEFKDKKIIHPTDIFSTNSIPKSATIIGTGPVAVCTAARLIKKGVQVTLAHNNHPILAQEDEEIAHAVSDHLAERGVVIQEKIPALADHPVILATGLISNSEGFDLKKADVYVAPTGRVVTDDSMRTPNPRIYAVGAVTGPPFSLSLESFQAGLAAENLFAPFFSKQRFAPEPFPRTIPFDPPIASIGLTEKEARAQFRDAHAEKATGADGLIKLVGRKRSGELLGAHLFTSGANELILYFDLIMRAGISLRDVLESHHYPVPSQAEHAHAAIVAWLK